MSTEWEGDEARKPLLVAGNHIDSSIWVVVASTTVAVCGSFVFGISVGYSSPSQEGIMRDLDLSLAEYSVFGSILTIGAMLGAILSGTVADRVGRRGAMAMSDVFCILGYLLIVFSKDFVLLYLGRFSTGCGIGLLSYVVPVYISEITPKNLRGRFAAANQLMVCFGASFAYAMGTFITWRTMAIIGVTPCLLQLVGLLMIPESPRWLVKTGHPRAFEEALQKLRGEETDIAKEAAEIKDFTEKLHHLPQSKILDLFHKDYINAVTVGVGLMVLQQFGGSNAIIFYASGIFVSAGFASGNTGMLAMVAVQIPMTTLGVLLLDKAGRRPLLMVSAAGTCLGCLLVAVSFLSKELHWAKDLNVGLALAGILVFVGSFSLGIGGIPWVIMSEIFPIHMKGSAGSLVTLVNWLSSWIVSYAFNFLLVWSSSGTFFMFASICGLTILFVERLVPETKGRTLEEIQASMNSSLARVSPGINRNVPVYISEITPKNLRGRFAAANQLMVCFGASFAYALGTFITWRTMAIVGVAPCLMQLVGLLVIPESPRWLAKTGHPGAFEEALQKLRGEETDVAKEAAEIKDFTEKLDHLPQSKILDLFHKDYIHAVTVGVGLMILQQFGGSNAIIFYASGIFVSAGFASGSTGMLAMVAVQIPMTTLGVLLLDKAGRRPLLMVSAAGTCLGCLLVAVSFLSKELHWAKDLNVVLALAGILVFTGSFSLGIGGIPWVIMSEIFPTHMKGSAGSLVTLVNWLSSWIVSYAFNFLLVWSSSGTFFMFASICGLTILFVERLVPETKGRTLEEIQASMNSSLARVSSGINRNV